MSKSGYAITWTSKVGVPGSGFIECDDKSWEAADLVVTHVGSPKLTAFNHTVRDP